MLHSLIVEADDGRIYSQVLIVDADDFRDASEILSAHFSKKGVRLVSIEKGVNENPLWEDVPVGMRLVKQIRGHEVVAASGRIYEMPSEGAD